MRSRSLKRLSGYLAGALAVITVFIYISKQSSLLSHMPIEHVFSFAGYNCACSVFYESDNLASATLLASVVAGNLSVARVYIDGSIVELKHAGLVEKDGYYVNEYESVSAKMKIRSKETDYKIKCSTYPDPPPHGSCFVGTLDIAVGKKSESLPIIEVCGC